MRTVTCSEICSSTDWDWCQPHTFQLRYGLGEIVLATTPCGGGVINLVLFSMRASNAPLKCGSVFSGSIGPVNDVSYYETAQ